MIRLIIYHKNLFGRNTNVVLQENHFFYGTIRDNLLLASDGLSDTEMEDILEKVKLGHFSLMIKS